MSGKKRVANRWLLASVILSVGMLIGAGLARSAELGETGYINEDTRICEFDSITGDNIEMFERYNSIIDRLEEVGIDKLTQVERMLGAFLTSQVGCGTVAQDYRVFVYRIEGDYALFLFDIGYEFEVIRYLMRLSAFHADEVL